MTALTASWFFAVLHLSEMLTAFKANYHAAWHGEQQQDAAS
jgi:hypothetical protein